MSRSFRATGARARQHALRTLLIAAAASVGTGLLLTACSATAGSSGGAAGSTSRHLAAVPAQGAPGVGNGAAASSDQAAGNFSGAKAAKLALSTQSIIYTANMTVRIKHDVTVAESQATDAVTAAGGYVASEQEFIPQSKHGIAQITLELKIPSAQFTPTLAKLANLGKKLSFSQRAQNVTQQVADV